MTKPSALVFYEALLPGTQLVNRLQDLGYEVVTSAEPLTLLVQARTSKPLVIVIDLATRHADICGVIRQLRSAPETAHVPVLAFAKDGKEELRSAAHAAGATLVAGDTAVLSHLPHLLDQVLEIDA